MLYERRHELVLAFLLKRTRDPEVAMDLMAETFAAALIALADVRQRSPGRPYHGW